MYYLDHAATTPVRPEVAAVVAETAAMVGNPSSTHTAGRAARAALEAAREQLAACLGAHPTEVVFTSGGTESANLAMQGIFRARARTGAQRIVLPTIEHHAVLDTAEYLAADRGAEISWVAPDQVGRISPAALRDTLADGRDVALAAIMWAHNEIGTINPIAELAEVCAQFKVPMFSDAVQAGGVLPINFAASGLSALGLAGHKIGAPIGTGALLVRRDAAIAPLNYGGGQERGLRSGTVNVAGAVGLALAMQLTVQAHDGPRLLRLRQMLWSGISQAVANVSLTGDPVDRLPGNLHLRFADADTEALLFGLDAAGVCASAGSACAAGVTRPSHVLRELGLADNAGSLRLSLGHTSSEADVAAVLAVIGDCVARARDACRRRRRAGGVGCA